MLSHFLEATYRLSRNPPIFATNNQFCIETNCNAFSAYEPYSRINLCTCKGPSEISDVFFSHERPETISQNISLIPYA